MIDARTRDRKISGSNQSGKHFIPWEMVLAHISSPHSCVKQVQDRLQRCLLSLLENCIAPNWLLVSSYMVNAAAGLGPLVKRFETSVILRYFKKERFYIARYHRGIKALYKRTQTRSNRAIQKSSDFKQVVKEYTLS